MKFGGTSVEDAAAIRRVVEIVSKKTDKKPLVVVSAMSGITSDLYKMAGLASSGCNEEVAEIARRIKERHLNVMNELIPGESQVRRDSVEQINRLICQLEEIVNVVAILSELSDRSLARIVSHGELLSSALICSVFAERGFSCKYLDAREFIITNNNYLKADPVIGEIKRRVPEVILPLTGSYDIMITQGFISSSQEGINTVLGRGGSDYSASLLGMALNVKEIEIWTDVDGVHTADPRYVKGTKNISELSFEEAAEMAYFGAKVLHPSTILPAIESGIPVRVLNSRSEESPGTLILPGSKVNGKGVRAITFKEHITVVNIFSTRMLNAVGFLKQVFDLFEKYRISVDLISTSEVNVSVSLEQGVDLSGIINELSLFSSVTVRDDLSQISVVGKDLRNTKGTCRRIFNALGDYKIYMISQGASEINLSFVVKRADLVSVLEKMHSELFN